jgi:ComF family protein
LHYLEGDFTAPHLDRVHFSRARSCFAYEGKILDAIHGLKYSKRFDLISVFAEYLVREAGCMGPYDMIVPVPVHWWRLWRRGYNQSALLARAVGKGLSIQVEFHALKKKRLVHPQVGLSRDERLKNMKGVFGVNRKMTNRLKGANVLIIDDVLTTGATVNECAKALISGTHCNSVDVLTIARTI